ncbi:hypothetical protein ES703_36967 [subsurface metagenome]
MTLMTQLNARFPSPKIGRGEGRNQKSQLGEVTFTGKRGCQLAAMGSERDEN